MKARRVVFVAMVLLATIALVLDTVSVASAADNKYVCYQTQVYPYCFGCIYGSYNHCVVNSCYDCDHWN